MRDRASIEAEVRELTAGELGPHTQVRLIALSIELMLDVRDRIAAVAENLREVTELS